MKKVHPRTDHKGPVGEERCSATLSLTSALGDGGWLTPRPGPFTPGEKIGYPLCRRLGGPQGRSGGVRKIIPTGIRFPDGPARSQSPYRLSYPGP